MSLIRNLIPRFKKDKNGIAAIEFAISIPLLMALFLGGYEVSQHMIYEMRLEKMAFTIADVSSQNDSLTNAQIDDIFLAAEQIFLPEDFSANGKVYITSVYRSTGNAYPTVMWQRSGVGISTQISQVGGVGLTATLPNNLSINEKENVIVVEVYYKYTPIFEVPGIDSESYNIRKTTVYKPRLGALTTSPT